MSAVVDKYLALYAEAEARVVQSAYAEVKTPFEVAVVVPLCGESPAFLAGLEAAALATPGLLVVVVVNAEVGASPAVLAANAQLVAALTAQAFEPRVVGPLLQQLPHPLAPILLVDRGQAPHLFPPKTGVGLARKLGSDVVLGLWRAGAVRSPWIYHCDADTTLPAAHFQRRMPESGAVSFPFAHVPSGNAEIDLATFEYEARLRYHLLGLRFAGSPFAYHSLGSSLAVHALSYARVRGFPKRAAGEDFYLLDKVNKIDRVHTLFGEPERIAARRSDRVPFGTGAAVEKLISGEPLQVDTPAAYAVLRQFYERIEQVVAAHQFAPLGDWLQQSAQAGLRQAAEALGVEAAFEEALRQTRTDTDLRRRLHGWFDGLKALRLLHGLRVMHPAVGLATALREAPFLPSRYPSPGAAEGSLGFWVAVCDQLRVLESA